MDTIGKLIWFKVPGQRISRAAYSDTIGTLSLPEPPSFRSAVGACILAAYPKGGKTWATRETKKATKNDKGEVIEAATDTYTIYNVTVPGTTAQMACDLLVREDGFGIGRYAGDHRDMLNDLRKLASDGANELRSTVANATLASLFIEKAETQFDCVFLTGRGIFVPRVTTHNPLWQRFLDEHARFLGWNIKSLPLVDEDEANRAVTDLLSTTFAGQYALIMKRIGELKSDNAIMKATAEGQRLLEKAARLGQMLRVELDAEVLELSRQIETAGTLNDIGSLGTGMGLGLDE